MSDRTIGILGGMGPEATADLFMEITRLTPARSDQDHLRIISYSNPKVPDRTAAILHGGADPVPELIESARLLERAGAQIIAIPCNTAHYYLRQIRAAVGIEVLDMIGETLAEFRRLLPRATTAGLLAATGTVSAGVYREPFERQGVRLLVPGTEGQAAVHEGIGRVKAGDRDPSIRQTFQAEGARLAGRGAEAVILGCTEIPLAFDPAGVDYVTLNATRILAAAALRAARGDAA